MRILQVTIYGELKYGGPPQKIFSLSRELAQRGHQVEILTFHSERSRGGQGKRSKNLNVNYLSWVGKGLRQVPADLRTLRQAVVRADVVHCYGLYDLLCPLTALLAIRLKRPYFLEPLGMYVPRARNVRAKVLYNRFFTSWMARRAAKVIATSPTEVEDLADLVDSRHIVLRRNGIDVSAFQQLPDSAVFRQAHDLEPQTRIILFMGRISPIKNLEQLVQAFHKAKLENAMLLMVGPMLEPEYEARLKTLIAKLDIADRVRLLGPLYGEDKLAALGAADLFVLPSQYESFGNAAAEAVAAGVPVLLTEGCGIAPLIHERAGLAVPADVPGLTNGLQIMLNDDQECAALTEKRAEVVRGLSWEEPLRLTEQLYEDVVTNKRPSRTQT